MPIAAQLPKWIDWTRGVIDPAIPWKLNANATQLAAPWITDALVQIYDEYAHDDGALQELTDACEQAMISAGDEVSARFVGLHLHYWLTTWARAGTAVLGQDDDPAEALGALNRTSGALAHLITLLPVDHCPRAWPRTRWEIMNACAGGLWKRAIDLYEFAERESTIAVRDARLMRGHFRYVLALDLDSRDYPLSEITWEPRVLGSHDAFHPPQVFPSVRFSDQLAQVLLFSHAVVRTAENAATEDRVDGLRDARNDLEKGLATPGSSVCGVYEAMLARCCLEVGDFGNAARHFQALLKRTIDFGAELGDSRAFRAQVFLKTAQSFRAALQPTDAADTLRSALHDFPNDRPLLMEQADLAAQETDFVQAFRSLKAATDADPALERDLGIRLGMALGDAFVSTKESAAALESALKQHPEIANLIADLVRAYWPTFSLLSAAAQDRWLAGLYHLMLTTPLEDRLRSPLLEDAVVAFAKAVEVELRIRIFKPAKAALGASAKANMGPLNRSQPEHRFVLFVIGQETKLTLGEMQRVLEATGKSREGLSPELRTWLSTKVPSWEELISLLSDIARSRNPAAHAEDDVELNARQVHAHCQRALDILVGQVRH